MKTFTCRWWACWPPKGQGAMGMDQDDIVLMPHRHRPAAHHRQPGYLDGDDRPEGRRRHPGGDGPDPQAAARRRKLADNDDDNFNIMDTRQIAETLSGTIRTMTALLGAVAAV